MTVIVIPSDVIIASAVATQATPVTGNVPAPVTGLSQVLVSEEFAAKASFDGQTEWIRCDTCGKGFAAVSSGFAHLASHSAKREARQATAKAEKLEREAADARARRSAGSKTGRAVVRQRRESIKGLDPRDLLTDIANELDKLSTRLRDVTTIIETPKAEPPLVTPEELAALRAKAAIVDQIRGV